MQQAMMSVLQMNAVIDGREREFYCYATCVTSSQGVAGMYVVSVNKTYAGIIHVINIMAETGGICFFIE